MTPLLVASLLVAGGLVALFFGAEWLVKGSCSLAVRLGITPLVIGLTVVACGTSMPELLVSLQAVLSGRGDIAIGNVIGSNIFNVGVILGVAALVQPMRVQLQIIRFDTPIMVGASVLFALFFWNQQVSRIEGLALTALLGAYLFVTVWLARKQPVTPEVLAEYNEVAPAKPNSLPFDLLLIFGGLGVLVVGSHLLVNGATEIALTFGVSEAVIGLTIIAAGTSMPELATSVVAAIKKESDIALGNIIGSNIFNVLGIAGLSASVRPITALGVQRLDLFVMLGSAVLLLPLIVTGFTIRRWEGAVLLGGYGVYLWQLWPK